MKVGDRIRAARKYAGLTQVQLSQKVGITQQTLTKLETGKAQTSHAIAMIAVECKVSPRWLATGDGQMLDDLPAPPRAVSLSPRELALIANYRAAADQDRASIERYALAVAEQSPQYASKGN